MKFQIRVSFLVKRCWFCNRWRFGTGRRESWQQYIHYQI